MFVLVNFGILWHITICCFNDCLLRTLGLAYDLLSETIIKL